MSGVKIYEILVADFISGVKKKFPKVIIYFALSHADQSAHNYKCQNKAYKINHKAFKKYNRVVIRQINQR